jgi:hypothetical protein
MLPWFQAGLDVTVPVPQIDHGRGDIAVTHPCLEGADVDAVRQMSDGVGVPELVQKPSRAERATAAAVDPGRAVVQFV